MLIIGAKGFAKEVLQINHRENELEWGGVLDKIYFYDDVNEDTPDELFGRFPVLKSLEEAKNYFETVDKKFTIGIGIPKLRKMLYEKFSNIGGEFTSTISEKTDIGNFGVDIEEGCNILSGVKISNDVRIGKGTMIYYNTIITHDVEIGEFVEISPNATLLGRCKVNKHTHIGAGSIILPDIVIGANCIIGAGAVVTKNIPDNSTAVGVPAKIIKNDG